MLYDPRWDSVRDTLHAAAQLVEQRGLCQGAMRDGGRICPLTAIYLAGGDVQAASIAVTGRLGRSIPQWGDAVGRTGAQVAALFRSF